MVDNETIKNLGYEVEKFDRKIANINLNSDIYHNKQEFEDLDKIYQKLSNKLEDCESEIQDSSLTSNKKPLINKLSQYKSDLEIAKNKLNEKKNRWKTQYNIELLKEGKLTGVDKIKTERGMILDQHKETDYQGNIIDSIASNVKDTNRNLEGINNELKNQGEQMNNIQDHALNAESQVKQTDKIMPCLVRIRLYCLSLL